MDGVVIAVAFNRDEYLRLKHISALEGEQHISSVIRKRMGMEPRFMHKDWILIEEFEELDNMKKMGRAIMRLASAIGYMRIEIGMLQELMRLNFKNVPEKVNGSSGPVDDPIFDFAKQ